MSMFIIDMVFLLIILSFLVASHSCIEIPIISEVLGEVGEVLHDVRDFVRGGVTDAQLNPCHLIESRNFICDEHFVTTTDGYILSIQHVINRVLIAKNKKTIKPVVVQHGFFGSATHWLINSEGGFADDWTGEVINANLSVEGRNLPYLLSNLGYDVWIPNLRGCRYSRNHTYLNPDTDNRFWDFSYDQMIDYDAPTIIDYVLKQTGYSKLGWIGHSLGTTIIFGLLSERPEYSAKIKPFIALGPVAYLGKCTSPLRLLANIPALKKIIAEKGGEFALPDLLQTLAADRVCVLHVANEVCTGLFHIFGDYNPQQFNLSRISAYIENGLCGSSVKTLIHFGYNIAKNLFGRFDYGLLEDDLKYGSKNPPEYNLGAINLENIILMHSNSDTLADPDDVETLKHKLTVPFIDYFVPDPKFAHLDFLWAMNVYEQVYKPLILFLRKFN